LFFWSTHDDVLMCTGSIMFKINIYGYRQDIKFLVYTDADARLKLFLFVGSKTVIKMCILTWTLNCCYIKGNQQNHKNECFVIRKPQTCICLHYKGILYHSYKSVTKINVKMYHKLTLKHSNVIIVCFSILQQWYDFKILLK